MTSVKKISESIESISVKKENLRKAFEDLRSHSSSLSSFTLKWEDIENHFDSIEKSIKDSFKELELKVIQLPKDSMPMKRKKSPTEESTAKETPEKGYPEKESGVKESPVKKPAKIHHPELKSLCANMDGKGLCSYLISKRKDLSNLKLEIAPALSSASDPPKIVLDAVECFHSINSKGNFSDSELAGIRRTCTVLLERLMSISPEIKPPVKEQAKKLAMEWKQKIGESEINIPFEGLGFLQLLATYGLVSVYDVDSVLDVIVIICRRKHTKHAIGMIRLLGLTDKIPDLIQMLINNGKQIDAVDFIYAFDLVEKFPPVPLLKAYVKVSRKAGHELLKKGKNSIASQNEATTREVTAIRAVIKSIKEHHLESKYSIEILEKRVSSLEQTMAAKKQNAKTAPAKPPKQPPNKKPRPAATSQTTVPAVNPTTIPSIPQQTQPHLMADLIQPYLGSSVPAFGFSIGPSTVYDRPASSILGTVPIGYGQARSYSDAAMASGFYDRPTMGYGAGGSYLLQPHQPPSYSVAAGLPQPHQPPSYYQ